MSGGTTFSRLWRPAAFIAAYILAAKASDGLTLEHGFTPWYPPAGMVLAYLIVVGPRGAGTVFAARLINTWVLVPEAWRDEPDGVIARAIAIMACYTAGAYLLRRVGIRRADLRELGWFAAIALVAVPLGSALSVGAASVVLLNESASVAFDSARAVWIGDSVSIATVVPVAMFVVSLLRGRRRPPSLPTNRLARVELALQVVALVAAPVLGVWMAERQSATGFLSVAVLPVIWVAMRGDLVTAAVGLLVANVSLTWAAATWLESTASMAELQTVMLASAVAAMYVAAVTHTNGLLLRRVRSSEARFRAIVDNAPSLVVRFDSAGEVTFANQPRWLGPDLDVDDVVRPIREDWPTISDAVMNGLGTGVERDWELATSTDERRWFSARIGREHHTDKLTDGLIAIITDLTPRRQAEVDLIQARWTDPLTGLVNRQRFLDLLVPLGREADGLLAVAVIDVDGFKGINESVGHTAADALLQEIASRLRDRAGSDGFAARLTADEFALAVPVAGEEDAAALGGALVRDLRVQVPIPGGVLPISCSVGMAYAAEVLEGDNLFDDAHSALNAAKEAGGDRVATFEAGHRLAVVRRERIIGLVRQAIDDGAVVVRYQPILDLATERTVGAEALVRLREPDGSLLLPGAFMDIVFDLGLDPALGALVLEQALADLATWPMGASPDGITVSVNVTARHLTQPGFVPQVLAACARHDISPRRVRLELTETMVLADLDAAVHALAALREHGVTVALDDFGVGYSSIAYLQRLPVGVLKIDRAFVSGLPHEDEDRSIVGLIVGLGRALGLEVTAEGIETAEQQAALLTLGCHLGQGFLFDRPVDASAIAARLAAEVAPAHVVRTASGEHA